MATPVLVNDSETKTDAAKKEYSIVHFNYHNYYGIENISIGHIYKKTVFSRFNFLKSYKIITVVQSCSLKKSKNIYLLTRDDIRRYRSKYKFLHIGLVQFSISCPSRLNGATIPVSISLRDSKYPEFEDSILVNVDWDLRMGEMNFNWFPKFSTSLADLANSNNGLVVTIDPSDSSTYLKVKYKVCYKLMKKSLKPDYLFDNPVLELNTKKANVVVFKSDNQSSVQSVDC
jgi:hypothetical protein